MKRWYVVSTRPHQEARAAENLRRQSFRVWLPRLRRTRRHARRFDTVLAPLFPGYLFVEIDVQNQPWRSINGTFGVRSLITGEGGPAPLPDRFVSSLMDRSAEDVMCDATAPIAKGEKVRVVAGPFVDCIGTLVHSDGAARVQLLLSLFSGDVDVVLPTSSVISLA